MRLPHTLLYIYPIYIYIYIYIYPISYILYPIYLCGCQFDVDLPVVDVPDVVEDPFVTVFPISNRHLKLRKLSTVKGEEDKRFFENNNLELLNN